MTGEDFKYRAFISYSHADHGWGAWLHRGLERFRAPKRLAGEGARKLGRCFRDEAEMGAAAHLPEKIAKALGASDWLVVICSPRSATSEWVNKEIADFKALGRADRVLALVVAGKPGGSAAEDAPERERECFPAALRAGAEPLAVDVRKFGRGDALVRLVSEIIGVEYDALREREVRRRTLARVAAGAILATGLLLTAGALAGGYFAAQNYAASSAERSALYAREATALFEAGRYPEAVLMALEGDPAAQAGMVERWFNPDGYAAARHALVQGVTHNRLESSTGGGTGETFSTDISADGKRIATLASDGVARIWNAGEDKPVAEIATGHTGWAPMILHPDGAQLLTGGQDGRVRVWTPGAKEPLAIHDTQGFVALSLAFDKAGNRFVVGTHSGGAQLWEVGGAEPLATYRPESFGMVTAVAFSPDERHVAIAVMGGALQLHNVSTGELLATFSIQGAIVQGLVYDPIGTSLLILADDGGAHVWMPGSETSEAYKSGASAVRAAAWRDDSEAFVLLSDAGQLSMWRRTAETPDVVVDAGIPATRANIVLIDGGAKAITVTDRSVAKTWRVADVAEQSFANEGYVSQLALMPDGQRFVAGYDTGETVVWKAGEAAPVARFEGLSQEVDLLAVHPDGARVLVGASGSAGVWRVGSAELDQTLTNALLSTYRSAAFTADGARLAVTPLEGGGELWRSDGGASAGRFAPRVENIYELAALPDGKRFLVAAEKVSLWQEGQDKPLQVFAESNYSFAVTLLADGERFLTADSDNTIRLWKIGEDAPLARFATGEYSARAIAMHPDGRHFLVVMSGWRIDVWRLDGRGRVASFRPWGSFAPGVLPLADGRRFVAGDGQAQVWRLPDVLFADAAGEVAAACEMLRAAGLEDFSEEDWLRFPILDRGRAHPCRGVWGRDPRRGAGTN